MLQGLKNLDQKISHDHSARLARLRPACQLALLNGRICADTSDQTDKYGKQNDILGQFFVPHQDPALNIANEILW
jgi:hypothetical protein